MKKHKGLLRIDLRSNAGGLSGVLEMMPKGTTKSATASASAADLALISAESTLLTNMHHHVLQPKASACGSEIHNVSDGCIDQAQKKSGAGAISSESIHRQQGAGSGIPQKTSRKGLVPIFKPDSQHTAAQPGKENQLTGTAEATVQQAIGSRDQAGKAKPAARPKTARSAGKAHGRAKHARQHSTAGMAAFEFDSLARPEPQSTAHLNQFGTADELYIGPEIQQASGAGPAGFSQGFQAHLHACSSVLGSSTVGSATFGDWNNRPAEEAALHEPRSELLGSSAVLVFERPCTAGIAGSARRTVSFQEHHRSEEADHSRHQQETACELASDAAYMQGMSQAWREVEAADNLGRERAAADFEQSLQKLGAAGFSVSELLAGDASAKPAAAHSGEGMAATSVNRARQGVKARPASAHPGGRPLGKKSTGAALREGADYARSSLQTGCQTHMPHDNALRAVANPAENESGELCNPANSAADNVGGAIHRLPDQAGAAAAAAMEAAKMNVWKAEVLCEIEGLKCRLKGATADRRR